MQTCDPRLITRPDVFAYGRAIPEVAGWYDYRICYRQSATERLRTLQALSWSWRPYSCAMRPIDGAAFDAWLGKRTLLFLGDSLNAQMYYSLSWLLGDSIAEHKDLFGYETPGANRTERKMDTCTTGVGNEGGWLLNTGEGRMQDIRFIEAVIDHLSNQYCLDQRHMYAVGYSLGGMYSYEAACHLNHRLSGIVSVAGSMPVNPTSCEITSPLPILHIHGTDDPIIPYYEDWDWKEWDAVGTMRSVPSLIEYWAERYDCQDLENDTVGRVQHVIRGDCDEGVRIEHYAISGLEHDWPQTIEGRPFPEVIWELMSEFRRP